MAIIPVDDGARHRASWIPSQAAIKSILEPCGTNQASCYDERPCCHVARLREDEGRPQRIKRSWQRLPVRNMGNFNFSLIHVLTFFHHVEQCCYPSFLIIPHIPAMTSHVAYVIYATFTLITTQGLCNITFPSYVFLFLMHVGPYFSYVPYLFSFYPCRLTHSV